MGVTSIKKLISLTLERLSRINQLKNRILPKCLTGLKNSLSDNPNRNHRFSFSKMHLRTLGKFLISTAIIRVLGFKDLCHFRHQRISNLRGFKNLRVYYQRLRIIIWMLFIKIFSRQPTKTIMVIVSLEAKISSKSLLLI